MQYLGPGVDKRDIVYVLVCKTNNCIIGNMHSETWRVRMRCSRGYRWVASTMLADRESACRHTSSATKFEHIFI
jgi:hypothetical protein